MRFSGSFSSTGLRGPKGDPGSSINFKATVPTIGDLPSGLQASEDDARVVTVNGHVYIYNGTEWIDGGQFLGPQGEQGANGANGTNGAQGPQGEPGPQGPAGITNAHDSVHTSTSTSPAYTYTAGTIGADGGTGVGAYITYTATGVLSVDGHTMLVGERMLVRAMADAKHNGIYVVTNAGGTGIRPVITRATDFDNHIAGQVDIGDFTLVSQGTNFAGKTYMMNASGTGTNRSIKIGTDNITWAEVNGVGATGATGATGADGKGYILSTTSYNPSSAWSTGSNKTITTSIAPNTTAFVVGSRVRVSRTSSNYIEGVITSLDNISPYSIVLTVDKVVGSSSSAVHTISIAGEIGATGSTGATGSSGADGSSLNPRGNWNSSTSYSIDDVVYHAASNASYVATLAGSNHIPSSSSTYWTTIAQDGANGVDGTPGVSWVTAPTSYNSTGTVGQFAYSGSYLYACISTNRWIRITASAISNSFTSGGGGD